MNIKRPLMPGFLKRAEQKLLLNKPGIWSTRAHLVVYYGILFLLTLTILCFLEPNDPRASSTTAIWTGFVSIISGIGIIVWLIYLLRFNVFKKYGIIHPLHGLVTFLLFFISTAVLVSFAFVHPVMESVRANIAYGDQEIVNDINAINVKIYQLEYNQLQQPWGYDTVELVYKNKPESDPIVDTTAAVPYYDHRYRVDSAAFESKIENADSLIKLTDSLYVIYATPNYSFLSPYMYYSQAKAHMLTDFEIFHKVHGHPPTAAEQEIISRELKVLLEKYKYYRHKKYYGYEEIDEDDTPKEKIGKRYQLGNIDSGIGHIMEKKYRWSDGDKFVFIRIFYYVTLGITLLIFIFRHTSIRTFFLSILAGVLLAIFTAMIVSFSRAEPIHFLGLMIMYTFAFFIGSLTVWRAKKRNAVAGITVNLFVFIITALPVFILGWYYHYEINQTTNGWRRLTSWDFEDYAIYAEVAGALLLLILLATYIGKLYRRWFALPEN